MFNLTKKTKNKGVALFLVLGVVTVTLIGGFALISFLNNQSKMANKYSDTSIAMYIAEAGIEEALHQINQEMAETNKTGGADTLRKKLSTKDKITQDINVTKINKEIQKVIPKSKIDNIEAVFHMKPKFNNNYGRTGELEITCKATFEKSGIKSSQTVTMKYLITGVDPRGIAPEHGFYLKESPGHYTSKGDRDLHIYCKKAYFGPGKTVIDLGNNLNPLGDSDIVDLNLGWADYGYGLGSFRMTKNKLGTTDKTGIVAVADVVGGYIRKAVGQYKREETVKIIEGDVYRRYAKLNPHIGRVEILGMQFPFFKTHKETVERYRSDMNRDPDANYKNTAIETSITDTSKIQGLLTADMYRKMATYVFEKDPPGAVSNPNITKERIKDWRVKGRVNGYKAKNFVDIKFEGGILRKDTVFKNVKPFYGWGRPPKGSVWYKKIWNTLSNKTRRDYTFKPVELPNGIIFVDGDVFIEGYIKNWGTIVATGNIYIGNDILKHKSNKSKTALKLYAIGKDGNPNTGKIIIVPYVDKNFSRLGQVTGGILAKKNFNYTIYAKMYAKNGLELPQKTGTFSQWFSANTYVDVTIYGGLVCERLDREKMPHDLKIYEDPDAIKLDNEIAKNHGLLFSLKDDGIISYRIKRGFF